MYLDIPRTVHRQEIRTRPLDVQVLWVPPASSNCNAQQLWCVGLSQRAAVEGHCLLTTMMTKAVNNILKRLLSPGVPGVVLGAVPAGGLGSHGAATVRETDRQPDAVLQSIRHTTARSQEPQDLPPRAEAYQGELRPLGYLRACYLRWRWKQERSERCLISMLIK